MAKTYSGPDIEKRLKKKGFVFLQGRGDHRYLRFVLEGCQTHIMTKVSHARKDVRPHILKKIAEQCVLSVQDLYALLECPLREEDYAERVRVQMEAHRPPWPRGTRLPKARAPAIKPHHSSAKKLPPP